MSQRFFESSATVSGNLLWLFKASLSEGAVRLNTVEINYVSRTDYAMPERYALYTKQLNLCIAIQVWHLSYLLFSKLPVWEPG